MHGGLSTGRAAYRSPPAQARLQRKMEEQFAAQQAELMGKISALEAAAAAAPAPAAVGAAARGGSAAVKPPSARPVPT